MITSAKFKHVKCLHNVQLSFDPLTVLVGPNSSGKSTILAALQAFSDTGEGTLPAVFSGPNSPDALVLQNKDRFSIDITTESKQKLGLRFSRKEEGWFVHRLEEKPDGEKVEDGRQLEKSGKWLAAKPIRSQHFKLSQEKLVAPSGGGPAYALDSQGGGLPALLSTLASAHRETFQRLVTSLESIVPVFQGVSLDVKPVWITEHDEHGEPFSVERDQYSIRLAMKNIDGLSASNASEGLLFLLAILAMVYSPRCPAVLLIDNIDAGLHPAAAGRLIELLRESVTKQAGVQIIATTHSPYLIDHLPMESVRLLSLDDNGNTLCGRLDDHPEFPRWKDEMLPGEFWSMVGEDWLRQRVAAKS
ncbi:MAG: AAA family ATPase [Planctomycetes bacterium]|nr:AAA family ATPase [Planctomycetota bacterium]